MEASHNFDTAEPAPVTPAPGEPVYTNDAVMLGVETDAYNALLEQSATLLTGELWGPKDRRNTQDNEWNPVTMPWSAWIVGGPGDKNTPAWGFSRHPVGKDKAGACIVLGSSTGKARKAKAMDMMYAMGVDIDAGFPLDSMLDRLEDLGLFCLVYTTHSHGKRGLQLKHDEVIRKFKIKPSELDLAQVQRFLRDHDKNRYEESFIAAVRIKTAKKQVKEGVVIELDTPPLDKYRLIFPLAAPVKIIDLADTHTAALEVWEDKITGLAREMLGVHFDTSCTDPSRLFFTPRHPKDAADWYCAIVQGMYVEIVLEPVPLIRLFHLRVQIDEQHPRCQFRRKLRPVPGEKPRGIHGDVYQARDTQPPPGVPGPSRHGGCKFAKVNLSAVGQVVKERERQSAVRHRDQGLLHLCLAVRQALGASHGLKHCHLRHVGKQLGSPRARPILPGEVPRRRTLDKGPAQGSHASRKGVAERRDGVPAGHSGNDFVPRGQPVEGKVRQNVHQIESRLRHLFIGRAIGNGRNLHPRHGGGRASRLQGGIPVLPPATYPARIRAMRQHGEGAGSDTGFRPAGRTRAAAGAE